MDEFIENRVVVNNFTPPKTILKKLVGVTLKESDNYICPCSNYACIINNISPTLTTSCGTYYTTKYNRYLSARECLNLQGFSKSFKQVTSKTQMYKQAGNTMSVNVLKEIIKQMLKCSV
jgi:DNA (cytosine-5)-methyltransferase 1